MPTLKINPRTVAAVNGGERALSKQSNYSTRPRIIQLFAWLSVIGGAL